jgi:hypothetical protein
MEEAAKSGNVKRAWVGKKGAEPVEIKIMEVPKAGEGAPPPENNYEVKTEPFRELELAGGKWAGTKTTIKMNDGSMESSVWAADNGWFDRNIRIESRFSAGTMSMALESFGKDAKPLLKWDNVKFDARAEEKKEPEKKEGEKKEGGK